MSSGFHLFHPIIAPDLIRERLEEHKHSSPNAFVIIRVFATISALGKLSGRNGGESAVAQEHFAFKQSSPKVWVSHVWSICSISINVLDWPWHCGAIWVHAAEQQHHSQDFYRGQGLFYFTCYECHLKSLSTSAFCKWTSLACFYKVDTAERKKAHISQASLYLQLINNLFYWTVCSAFGRTSVKYVTKVLKHLPFGENILAGFALQSQLVLKCAFCKFRRGNRNMKVNSTFNLLLHLKPEMWRDGNRFSLYWNQLFWETLIMLEIVNIRWKTCDF